MNRRNARIVAFFYINININIYTLSFFPFFDVETRYRTFVSHLGNRSLFYLTLVWHLFLSLSLSLSLRVTLLRVTRYSLFVIRYSLVVARYSLFVFRYLLFVTHYSHCLCLLMYAVVYRCFFRIVVHSYKSVLMNVIFSMDQLYAGDLFIYAFVL